MRQKGVRILSEAELDALPADAHIFIRTHGVERQTYERLAAGGYACTDAICPYVRKIHEIVSSAGPDAAVDILGRRNAPRGGRHPQLCGRTGVYLRLRGGGGGGPSARLAADAPAIAVAQTTFDVGEWKKFCEFFKNLYTNAKIFDTICKVTEERQKEVVRLAQTSDGMLVVGRRTQFQHAEAVRAGGRRLPDGPAHRRRVPAHGGGAAPLFGLQNNRDSRGGFNAAGHYTGGKKTYGRKP